eukprot:TRINITY_DN4274_c0_g1_i1.p1 TRINITY_DN4274_c0_g1~~TRINITY_DN4274_c0_g1_i1.p1  ORF type:complete len:741 (+),score=120.23 TRINITY_DN4274_c0_g1_i1:156-2378(+)
MAAGLAGRRRSGSPAHLDMLGIEGERVAVHASPGMVRNGSEDSLLRILQNAQRTGSPPLLDRRSPVLVTGSPPLIDSRRSPVSQVGPQGSAAPPIALHGAGLLPGQRLSPSLAVSLRCGGSPTPRPPSAGFCSGSLRSPQLSPTAGAPGCSPVGPGPGSLGLSRPLTPSALGGQPLFPLHLHCAARGAASAAATAGSGPSATDDSSRAQRPGSGVPRNTDTSLHGTSTLTPRSSASARHGSQPLPLLTALAGSSPPWRSETALQDGPARNNGGGCVPHQSRVGTTAARSHMAEPGIAACRPHAAPGEGGTGAGQDQRGNGRASSCSGAEESNCDDSPNGVSPQRPPSNTEGPISPCEADTGAQLGSDRGRRGGQTDSRTSSPAAAASVAPDTVPPALGPRKCNPSPRSTPSTAPHGGNAVTPVRRFHNNSVAESPPGALCLQNGASLQTPPQQSGGQDPLQRRASALRPLQPMFVRPRGPVSDCGSSVPTPQLKSAAQPSPVPGRSPTHLPAGAGLPPTPPTAPASSAAAPVVVSLPLPPPAAGLTATKSLSTSGVTPNSDPVPVSTGSSSSSVGTSGTSEDRAKVVARLSEENRRLRRRMSKMTLSASSGCADCAAAMQELSRLNQELYERDAATVRRRNARRQAASRSQPGLSNRDILALAAAAVFGALITALLRRLLAAAARDWRSAATGTATSMWVASSLYRLADQRWAQSADFSRRLELLRPLQSIAAQQHGAHC